MWIRNGDELVALLYELTEDFALLGEVVLLSDVRVFPKMVYLLLALFDNRFYLGIVGRGWLGSHDLV